MENREPSSTGLDANLAGALSYLTIIAGIIFFVLEKQSRFVKFNAMQSILLNVAVFVLAIVVMIIGIVLSIISNTLGCVASLLNLVLYVGAFIVWVLCVVKAYQGTLYKLPVIGDMAEKYAQ